MDWLSSNLPAANRQKLVVGIYFITNKITGKKYVGSSVNIFERWQAHVRELTRGTHHSAPLQRAWQKHGPNSFIFTIRRLCLEDSMLDLEQKFLDKENAKAPFGYNVSLSAHKVVLTFEARSKAMQACAHKLSAKAKDQWSNPEIRAKMLAGMKGKRLGVPLSEQHKHKISEGNKKRYLNPENKKPQARTMKALWQTEQFREKVKEGYKKRRARFGLD